MKNETKLFISQNSRGDEYSNANKETDNNRNLILKLHSKMLKFPELTKHSK